MSLRITLAWVLAFALLFVASGAAAQTRPPDVVVLRDGSLFRGTLIERSPERVVVQLATGEVRTWPAGEVEYAGPDTAAPEAPPASPEVPQVIESVTAAPPARALTLHVRSRHADVAAHVLVASSEYHVGDEFFPRRFDTFGPLCRAPCELTLDPGTYRFGISHGDGAPERADVPITLSTEAWLEVVFESREAERIAGWVMVVGGPVVFGAIGLVGLYFEWLQPEWDDESVVFGSLGVGVLVAIIGSAFAALNDHRDVRLHDHEPTFADESEAP